jgi:hypothetical protein
LLVPDNWRYPPAGLFIEDPDFAVWRTTDGADWYDHPVDSAVRDYTFSMPE